MGDALDEPCFLKERHIKYWLRCAKTFLPELYTSTDSTRISLAYFIVSALDLLNVLDAKVTKEERKSWIQWIYHCQVPEGGFRGSTGTDFGGERRTERNRHWDPANLPTTFFAIVTLIVLGDDLSCVRRKECLEWLPKLQRENGSFGETLGENGTIEGGNDLRFCCCAAGIRYILRGNFVDQLAKDAVDFDVGKLVGYIASCQSYEGGFGEKPFREAHSGLTYCAICALSFLGRTPEDNVRGAAFNDKREIAYEECVYCIVSRQSIYLEDIDENDHQLDAALPSSDPFLGTSPTIGYLPHLGPLCLDEEPRDPSPPPLSTREEDMRYVGFNGRPNKIVDTCYSFWNLGALAILHRLDLIDSVRSRRYLLGKVQHVVGGFGKGVGDPPDILHAYLGLASLALVDRSDLDSMDPTFCISERARSNLSRVSWWRG